MCEWWSGSVQKIFLFCDSDGCTSYMIPLFKKKWIGKVLLFHNLEYFMGNTYIIKGHILIVMLNSIKK